MPSDLEWQLWIDEAKLLALTQGISKTTIDRELNNIRPASKILLRDKCQVESTISLDEYLYYRLDKARIVAGKKLLNKYHDELLSISNYFNIQPHFIVSILGLESYYGKNQGSISTIEAVTTLAFDRRRSEFYKKQLIAALKIIDDGLTSLENNTGNAKTLIQSLILGQLPGINKRPNEVLGRFAGQIINPNLELIFGGPTLRSFQYSFRLTPRNDKETQAVRSIIRFFKQGMSIKENPTNLFLSAPNVFQPRFYNKEGRQHTFINTIKKCACTSFTVNYVPDNTFMTLPNSSMTAYEIGMSFQEMDPIIDQDYAELDDNQDSIIGF